MSPHDPNWFRSFGGDIVIVVETGDELGEDLDSAAQRLVAGGLRRVRHLIGALRHEGFPRRRGTLAAAARSALLAAGVPIRRSGGRRAG